MAGHLRAGLLLRAEGRGPGAEGLALVVALVPALALACPVCGQGRDGSGAALLVMTIIMTLLPLSMIAGVIGWVAWRIRKAEQASARPEGPVTEAALLSAKPAE